MFAFSFLHSFTDKVRVLPFNTLTKPVSSYVGHYSMIVKMISSY